ncbi:hypothetical protein EDC01DRAFT_434666 [Geopyxis carbonaria]|nr:hypothetical protein EDC01DRAFT_434666 [Geopyxis carbonaria]
MSRHLSIKQLNPFRNRRSSNATENPSQSDTKKGLPPSDTSSESAAPPPAYMEHERNYAVPNQMVEQRPSAREIPEETDPFEKLSKFDTVFVIDDSGSMDTDQRWQEVSDALSVIVPMCTKYDTNGVDIYFMNNHRANASGIKSDSEVYRLFSSVKPGGSTPTGATLERILEPYVKKFKSNPRIKPLNIICFTDGWPTDATRLKTAILKCAKALDKYDANERQVGVQFFQVGSDEEATDALEMLDNSFVETDRVRDMVDTVSWSSMNGKGGLTAENILKAVMGAVDKSLDRKMIFNSM